MEILGSPRTTKVVTVSGDSHDMTTAPKYLVYPIKWDQVTSVPKGAALVNDAACVIDFGEAYEISTPPPDLGIPQIYCSSEYTLEGVVGVGSDTWALGCTLFEIRTGRKLFDTFDDDKDEYLCKVVITLGKFPEPWWSDTWELRGRYFKDETDANGGVLEVDAHTVVSRKPEPRSLEEALRDGLYYEYGGSRPGGVERDIPEREVVLLADLLAKLLRYSPEDRLTAGQALEHDWFKLVEPPAGS